MLKSYTEICLMAAYNVNFNFKMLTVFVLKLVKSINFFCDFCETWFHLLSWFLILNKKIFFINSQGVFCHTPGHGCCQLMQWSLCSHNSQGAFFCVCVCVDIFFFLSILKEFNFFFKCISCIVSGEHTRTLDYFWCHVILAATFSFGCSAELGSY